MLKQLHSVLATLAVPFYLMTLRGTLSHSFCQAKAVCVAIVLVSRLSSCAVAMLACRNSAKVLLHVALTSARVSDTYRGLTQYH